jgi:TonB family protein
MKVVYQNLSGLRYLYTSWLRGTPGLRGKVTVKFAVDEFGRVVSVFVLESTLADPALERAIVERIRAWRFDRIDKPGDITEVVHPFVFST